MDGLVYVPCAQCRAVVEMPEDEWTHKRKPLCEDCLRVRPLGSFVPRKVNGYGYTREKKREQYRSERYWRNRYRQGANGIIRVISDWKEI